MPTARNARGVDVLAYSQDARTKIAIQVKALSRRAPVPLGEDVARAMGDWWVIVNNVAKAPVTFVMRPSEVQERAHRGEKNEKVSYWLQPKAYDLDEYREAWGRIGRGDDSIQGCNGHCGQK